MGGEERLPLPGWSQSCGRTLDNHYRHLDFDVMAVHGDDNGDDNRDDNCNDNGDDKGDENGDDKAMTMALTDSLTRPPAEVRAGNAGRTPCCRAS